MEKRACFFAHVADPVLLDLVEWYRIDRQILDELGYQVTTATHLQEIPWTSDVYFSWWCSGSVLPLILSRIRRKPLVILGYGSEVVNSVPEMGYHSLSPLKQGIVRATLKRADLVLSISRAMQDEARTLAGREAPVVYLAVDAGYYRPGDAPRTGHILSISHLNRHNRQRKALDSILRSMPGIVAACPGTKLIMVGDKQDAYAELLDLTRELGIEESVVFPGQVSRARKLELLQSAAIYVQPTRQEGFGVAIAEAMSCGLPVVTSAVGAVPEVVGDLGAYVDADDPAGIAQAAITLLRDPGAREARARQGRQRIVDHFSIARRRAKLASLLAARDLLPAAASSE